MRLNLDSQISYSAKDAGDGHKDASTLKFIGCIGKGNEHDGRDCIWRHR
jgi:hypothetical protein